MDELKFKRLEVLTEIRKTFPKSKILKYSKFKSGLVGKAYKINISSPKKILVLKIYKLKRKEIIIKGNKIAQFLLTNNIPTAKVYSNSIVSDKGLLLMDYVGRKNLLEIYNPSSKEVRKKVLYGAGKLLRQVHSLKAPFYWRHYKHNVEDGVQWISWTKIRVRKYLLFTRKKLGKKRYFYLKNEFERLLRLLESERYMKVVPLHWDYHLENVVCSDKSNRISIIDFDNVMKGHNLADIGQFYEVLIQDAKGEHDFTSFLNGYDLKITSKHKEMVFDYFLLHLIAVLRSIWLKKRLRWLIKDKLRTLDACIDGNYKI